MLVSEDFQRWLRSHRSRTNKGPKEAFSTARDTLRSCSQVSVRLQSLRQLWSMANVACPVNTVEEKLLLANCSDSFPLLAA